MFTNVDVLYVDKPFPSPIDVQWFPNNPGMLSTLSRGVLQFYGT